MSLKQAQAFWEFVNESEEIQEKIRSAPADAPVNLIELAKENGFEFTAEEAREVFMRRKQHYERGIGY